MFRALLGREPLGKFGSELCGIEHLVLGISGMDIQALEVNLGGGCVEVFKLQLADLPAIDGVGEIGSELGDVEMVCPLPYLLVRREGDTDAAMFHLGMRLQIVHRGDDGGNAGLIVGSEQGLAVRYDNVLAYIISEFRELGGRKEDVLCFIQNDISTLIGDDARLHVLARHIGTGVEMSDEADGRERLVGIRGEGCHQVAVLVERDIGQTDFLQLIHQRLGEDALAGGAGSRAGRLVRLRIVSYVFKKAFYYCHIFIFDCLKRGIKVRKGWESTKQIGV